MTQTNPLNTDSMNADPLSGVQQQMAELARQAAAVQQHMDQIRPAATSPDGAVTVSVTAAGTLDGIRFGAAARSMELDALAAAIMRTATEAHRIAAVRTQDALADLTGPDSAPVREMGRFIPPADDAVTETDTPSSRPAGRGGSAPGADEPEDDGFTGRGQS